MVAVMDVRLLGPADEPALERFLAAHRDSSMFLRANARRGGLVYDGQPHQATYAAAVDGDAVLGVVAHAWSGMVLLQGAEHVEELAHACLAWSGRTVTGLSGPLAQVRRARTALGMAAAEAAVDADEGSFALDLSTLSVPAALTDGTLECRPPRPEERDTLRAWRVAYDIEVLGSTDSEETRSRSASFLDAQIANANAWVARAAGQPVSLSAFNAALPDIVQLGGIYTPPNLRGHGYAKVAVAASLLAARERQVSRAVLFTNNPSAIRCYEALGFRLIGEYGLVLLR